MTKNNTFLLSLVLLLAACSAPRTQTERYHRIADDSKTGVAAVDELQREAIGALNRGSTRLAIDYLQRAIKIEPRNAFTWHYLAQIYWRNRDRNRCIDMVERSMSYSSSNDDLDRANSALRKKCGSD